MKRTIRAPIAGRIGQKKWVLLPLVRRISESRRLTKADLLHVVALRFYVARWQTTLDWRNFIAFFQQPTFFSIDFEVFFIEGCTTVEASRRRDALPSVSIIAGVIYRCATLILFLSFRLFTCINKSRLRTRIAFGFYLVKSFLAKGETIKIQHTKITHLKTITKLNNHKHKNLVSAYKLVDRGKTGLNSIGLHKGQKA